MHFLIEPRNFFYGLQKLLLFLFQNFVGDQRIGNLEQVAGRERAAFYFLPHADNFLDDQRRPRQRFEHGILAPLDALGDFHLALAREQGNRTHLAQIHADRIVSFIAGWCGQQVEIQELVRFLDLSVELRLFQDFDAGDVEPRQQVVQVCAAVQIRRQDFADLVVQHVALFLAHGHEPSETIVFFLYCHWEPPCSALP